MFKLGDRVQLKTGGPQMTVDIAVGDLLLCSWVSPTQRVYRHTYSVRELQLAEGAELLAVRAIRRLASRWSVAGSF